MIVLATAVPQAPLEQSLRPNPKFAFLQRQAALAEAHPSAEYWASMLAKQVWPHVGRLESAVVVAGLILVTVAVADAAAQ
jgi:hypothetical protein